MSIRMTPGLIGFGKLGQAFCGGLFRAGFDSHNLYINARSTATLETAGLLYPQAHVCKDKAALVENADVIFLCVEPAVSETVCCELAEMPLNDKIIVSFISGVTVHTLRENLRTERVLRVMPNLAISVGQGVLGIVKQCPFEDEPMYQEVLSLLSKLGRIVLLDERDLEKLTVSAACGLAYTTMLVDAYMTVVGEYMGHGKMSRDIAIDTFAGALAMLRDMPSEAVVNKVAAKGGSTEAGLAHMNEGTVVEMLRKVLAAAYTRATT